MHHAQLFIQNPNDQTCVQSLIEELSIGSGDVRTYFRERFSVDDARDAGSKIWTSPMASKHTLTVIATHKIDHEAQNALLKVCEEPPAHAYIALIVPSEDMILPTLRSRFVLGEKISATEDFSLAKSFLSGGSAERKKIVEKIHKDKDTATARKLIQDLEVLLGMRKDKEVFFDELQDLVAFRQYTEQKGAGNKYMLEHLALTLPTMS